MRNSMKIAQQARVLRLYLLSFINYIYDNDKSDYKLATKFREAKSQWCDLKRMVEDTGILDIESEE